ncbi:FAD-dependent monooxygenase [Roseobacteraceae bacterium S113]
MERSAVYQFQARWAESWVCDRVMIAGDAAHLMPPFAGEGMCAGLRDAVALDWRLAAILQGHLPQDALASYESERKEHARHYIQFSQDLGEIICIADPAEAAARDARMMAELEARDYAPITGDLVQLGAGAWIADAPSAGSLAPQGTVAFDGQVDRFDQAVGAGWCMLAFEAEAQGVLTPAQEAQLRALGGRLLQVGAQGPVVPQDEAYATWHAQTGARYVLIRPDFYVAATAETPAQMQAHFAQVMAALCAP